MIWRQNTCVNWFPLESHPENSFSHILLQVPVSRLKSYGDCAFSVAAPTLWNRLPADIRNASSLENLKSVLKTHLFKVAFIDK